MTLLFSISSCESSLYTCQDLFSQEPVHNPKHLTLANALLSAWIPVICEAHAINSGNHHQACCLDQAYADFLGRCEWMQCKCNRLLNVLGPDAVDWCAEIRQPRHSNLCCFLKGLCSALPVCTSRGQYRTGDVLVMFLAHTLSFFEKSSHVVCWIGNQGKHH